MQILFFEKEIYGIVTTLFSFAASIYDFMIDLTASKFFDINVVESFVNTIYVLIGVFMLFRIAVSFLNMLIEPDRINDKQAGASKILVRMFVVLVLIISLAPKGFVYPFLERLEQAIINPEDGLITNITKRAGIGTTVSKFVDDTNPFQDEIKKVNAITENDEMSATKPVTEEQAKVISCYATDTATNKNYTFQVSEAAFAGAVALNDLSGKANGIYIKGPSSLGSDYVSSTYRSTSINRGSNSISMSCFEAFQQVDGKIRLYKTVNECPECTTVVSTSKTATEIETQVVKEQEETIPLTKGRVFARNVLMSTSSCSDKVIKSGECKDKLENIMTKNTAAVKDIKAENISISFIPAMLLGIVIVIYLIVLCVEVILRELKLMLLQMIAPIPIMSYIDPKDKIFGEWTKMYISTYVDLFIKLFAITIGTFIITGIEFNQDTVIKQLLMILAVLLFIKIIPTMINKIFGIDIASGSLKDTFGMIKKGAGFAAGAAVGGVATAATGVMAIRATKGQSFGNRLLAAMSAGKNTVGGVVSGAIGGSKGKIGSGLSYSAKNMAAKGNYENGLTAGGLLMGATAGKVGMDYASRVDRKNINAKDKQKTLDEFTKFKGSIEEAAESSDFTKTLRQKVAAGDLSLEEDEIKQYRDTWAEYQIAENNARQKVISSDFVKKNQISLANKVAAGTITQEQADIAQTNFVNSEIMTELEGSNPNLIENIKNAQKETGVSMKIEGGKQSAIVSAMENANATVTGSSTVRGVVGDKELTSFKELKNANTTAKKEATRIGNEIFASEATDKYQISKLNREAANGSER